MRRQQTDNVPLGSTPLSIVDADVVIGKAPDESEGIAFVVSTEGGEVLTMLFSEGATRKIVAGFEALEN
jgi:hypothetical protein